MSTASMNLSSGSTLISKHKEKIITEADENLGHISIIKEIDENLGHISIRLSSASVIILI
jgi:hypothetical protein